MQSPDSLRMMVFAALMAALIAIGAFVAVPIGPVPIVLQNFFVLLAGMLLGSRWGLISVGVYLAAGACGLPVFAGGSGGLGHLIGPRGGYLFGYLPAVWVIGWIAERGGGKAAWEVIGMAIGSLLVYTVGVPWLGWMLNLEWPKALAVGMYPFLIGDALKIAAAVPVVRSLRPLIRTHAMKAEHA